MSTNNVRGIDVIVKKKPGGAITTVHLSDNGNGWTVGGVEGADASEYHFMGEIGKLVAGLVSGLIQHASVTVGPGGPGGKHVVVQCQSTSINTSRSNVKNN